MVNDINQMKLEAQEMSAYYFKGFGAGLNTILAASDNYLSKPESKKIELCNSIYHKLTKPYNGLVLYDFEDRPVFCVLPEIQRILPELGSNLHQFFQKPAEHKLNKINEKINDIHDLGSYYDRKFKSLISSIRSHSETKDFSVQVQDINGKIWNI